MGSFFYILLFILWMMFWSFASVVIYRLKSWEKWIWTWRSHCNSCWHMLNYKDLIPLFSYILNFWKCKYCKKKVSVIYPILEITSWFLYLFIWYFLIDFSLIVWWNTLEITKLFFFLIIWFLSIVYTFYDILFLEIHEAVLWIWVFFSILVLSLQTVFPAFHVIPFLPIMSESLIVWTSAIVLTFIIVWLLYVIMLKWLKEMIDIIILIWIILSLVWFKYLFDVELSSIPILSWVIWALGLFIFFFLQILISGWAWMWWGDLRIAILIGLILWIPFTFAWGMITYLVWSILWIFLIIYSRINKLKNWTKMNTQIPFWPFLALWFFITMFYYNEIWSFIEIYFRWL